ncbi:MAG: RNA polymerase sigma factor [Saprospiraceae bacterium]
MNTKDYNECVDLYSDNIYRFVLKSVRDEETANDIVQDTFMRMWQHVEKVDLNRAKSYLFKIANNLLIDLHRKSKFVSSNPVEENSLFYNHEYSDLKEHLDRALNLLPESQKTVLMLRDYEDYSYDEIGEITGLSASQVKVYIYRARKKMKDILIKAKIDL